MTRDMYHATLVSLFCERVAASGDKPAVRVRDGERFRAITWNALAADVRRMAAALVDLGVAAGDRVAHVSENRYEWIVVDLAVHLARGVHVAIHCSLAGPQIAYQIADSGATLVIVSGPEQAQKLIQSAASLPPGMRVFSHDPCSAAIQGCSIQHLAPIAAQASEAAGLALEQAAAANVKPADLATILYTSGTTGEPKGVMLSHGNLASNAIATLEAFCTRPGEVRLCWLPLSHIYARTCDLYISLADGAELALAKSRETIVADAKLVHPTFINGVPYFYDKICRHLQEKKLDDKPGSINELLGGRLEICCAGGAPLPDHTAEIFERQGVKLFQGYGLTESSPVIATEIPTAHRIGTVGPPIPGVEVKIADDGEVLTCGPHVMLGYWNKPQATAEALRDGWLYTGDLGRMDDGFLRITGRKKELIVTAAGKNIAPTYLEGLLAKDPLISQVMVIGDRRNYLTALIVPDRERLTAEIMRQRIPVFTPAQAVAHPRVNAIYRELIDRRLAGVSTFEQVQKFTLLDRGLTVESGELTPTLKLRRDVILANCAEAIEKMYAESEVSNVAGDV